MFLIFLCLFPTLLSAREASDIVGDRFEETEGRGLVIRTNPHEARVFIDGIERGLSPLSVANIQSGEHSVRLVKEGYRDRRFNVTLFNNSRLVVSIEMEEERGFAFVSVRPVQEAEGSPGSPTFNPQIFTGPQTDGSQAISLSETNTTTLNLPAGMRTIRARAFGWEDASATVLISDNVTSPVDIFMKPAAFKMEKISQSRPRINPENTDSLGSTEYRFEVTAAGTGKLKITDKNDSVVYEKELPPFETWNQSVSWNGKDSSGNSLPEGTYSCIIEASPLSQNTENFILKFETEINYSLNIFPVSLTGGIGGLVYAPLPHTLPKGSFQIEGGIVFGSFRAPDKKANQPSEIPFSGLPFEIGARFAPVNDLEIAAAFNVNSSFDNLTGWGIAGSIKYNILDAPFLLSAAASYSWAGENAQAPQSPGRGIALYAPLSFDVSGFSFVLSPGILWRTLGSAAFSSHIPVMLLSSGVLYRRGWTNSGVSVRSEFDFNREPFADNVRFLAGAEFRINPPPSNLTLFFQAGLWTQGRHAGGYGGLGIGIIY